MSKRLQVLFQEEELAQIRAAAEREGVTVAEWVRQKLRKAQESRSPGSLDLKLKVLRAATRHEFPTADIDQMLAEIESGYQPVE